MPRASPICAQVAPSVRARRTQPRRLSSTWACAAGHVGEVGQRRIERVGQLPGQESGLATSRGKVADDLATQVDAAVTDEDGGPGHEGFHVGVRLQAEGAAGDDVLLFRVGGRHADSASADGVSLAKLSSNFVESVQRAFTSSGGSHSAPVPARPRSGVGVSRKTVNTLVDSVAESPHPSTSGGSHSVSVPASGRLPCQGSPYCVKTTLTRVRSPIHSRAVRAPSGTVRAR